MAAEPLLTIKETDDGLEVSAQGPKIRNVEDLLAHAEIDSTRWEVVHAQVRKWDAAIGGGRVEVMYYVRVSLKPAHPLIATKDEILAEIAAHSPSVEPLRISPKVVSAALAGRYLLEISPFDLHLGMRAWAAQTGNHYGPDTAAELFRRALDQLLARAAVYPIERVLFVMGNDFLHVDSREGRTTNGTPQDCAMSWQEMFRVGRRLMVEAIDKLKLVAPVNVVTVPGNHDEQGSLFLGEVLQAWYRADANVEVDASPTYRKYFRFGQTLLGFTHGKYERLNELPAIMARDEPAGWASTTHREWHLGHKHKLEADEIQGVRVRRLPSLAAKDDWHTREGYGSLRAMEAYLWEYDCGYAGHLNINVSELTR